MNVAVAVMVAATMMTAAERHPGRGDDRASRSAHDRADRTADDCAGDRACGRADGLLRSRAGGEGEACEESNRKLVHDDRPLSDNNLLIP